MDHGTPRLVTKNRNLQIKDPKALQSRNMLLNLANQRKGLAELPQLEKKQDFNQNSVKSFRQRMMEEEKKDQEKGPEKI